MNKPTPSSSLFLWKQQPCLVASCLSFGRPFLLLLWAVVVVMTSPPSCLPPSSKPVFFAAVDAFVLRPSNPMCFRSSTRVSQQQQPLLQRQFQQHAQKQQQPQRTSCYFWNSNNNDVAVSTFDLDKKKKSPQKIALFSSNEKESQASSSEQEKDKYTSATFTTTSSTETRDDKNDDETAQEEALKVAETNDNNDNEDSSSSFSVVSTVISIMNNTVTNITNNNLDLQKLQSFQNDIQRTYKHPRDLASDGFHPLLLPLAEKVDEVTGGWGLSYADLTPATPTTPAGVAFLATNACYALAGLALGVRGEFVLGTMTELAGVISFWYHYSQLKFGQNRSEVRLALLMDYITATTTLLTGGAYMVSMGVESIPLDCIIAAVLSVICLTLSWVWEFGYPYLFWHSLWHILSAYAGYLVGRAHMGDIDVGMESASSAVRGLEDILMMIMTNNNNNNGGGGESILNVMGMTMDGKDIHVGNIVVDLVKGYGDVIHDVMSLF